MVEILQLSGINWTCHSLNSKSDLRKRRSIKILVADPVWISDRVIFFNELSFYMLLPVENGPDVIADKDQTAVAYASCWYCWAWWRLSRDQPDFSDSEKRSPSPDPWRLSWSARSGMIRYRFRRWQWWVSRANNAVEGLAIINTLLHSEKTRLVVMRGIVKWNRM